jgi:hypothetical protein
MTPVERAAAVYEREACARAFREDMEAHLLNGYVFSTPEVFVMGRLVQHDAPAELIVNPWHRFEEGDAWLVYLLAGDIRTALGFFPSQKKYIAWEIRNSLRVHLTARVIQLCTRSSASTAHVSP